MILVFKTDWTRTIKAYTVTSLSEVTSEVILPAFTFSSDDSVDNVITLINEFCNYKNYTISQVIFSGHASILRQLEKYFKETDKEILKIWQ